MEDDGLSDDEEADPVEAEERFPEPETEASAQALICARLRRILQEAPTEAGRKRMLKSELMQTYHSRHGRRDFEDLGISDDTVFLRAGLREEEERVVLQLEGGQLDDADRAILCAILGEMGAREEKVFLFDFRAELARRGIDVQGFDLS